MTVKLRHARAADAEIILSLIQALAEYEREPDAVKLTLFELREQLTQENPPFECILAEHDGQACGLALFFQNYSTWRGRAGLYLEDLFVIPEARGLGIGKALLAALAVIARSRDYARMEWSVLDWNQPSIDFYERLGAKPMTGWTTFRLTGDALQALAASAEHPVTPSSR